VKDLVPETIWTYQEVGHTQDAKKEVIKILGGMEAPLTPKPVDLIQRICWIASEPGDIVLDSFAGSGTTAHAVLRMNAEGKGDRKFVLVQQADDTKNYETERLNICQQVTARRVSRVITGYDYVRRGPRGKRTEMNESGLGGRFTYARLGRRLFGKYRDLGENYPAFDELAKYVFYMETSRDFDGAGSFGHEPAPESSPDAAGPSVTKRHRRHVPSNRHNRPAAISQNGRPVHVNVRSGIVAER
jgi:hypothetical protein